MCSDSAEGSGRAETEIRCNSLWHCVSKPQALEEIERIYRMAESSEIGIHILDKCSQEERLPISSRAFPGLVGEWVKKVGYLECCGACAF